MHSELLLDHFQNPQNVGVLDKSLANIKYGEAGSSSIGAKIELYVQIDDGGLIEAAKFKAFGGVELIACCSWITEQIIGKSLADAAQLAPEKISEALALPPLKMHVALLVADAMQNLIGKNHA